MGVCYADDTTVLIQNESSVKEVLTKIENIAEPQALKFTSKNLRPLSLMGISKLVHYLATMSFRIQPKCVDSNLGLRKKLRMRNF
jgi:fatty acid-binding protein DegV